MAPVEQPRIHRCPACSAPLEVPEAAPDVNCGYCNAHVVIERRAKPKNAPTPAPQRGGEAVLYTEEATKRVISRALVIALAVGLIGVVVPVLALLTVGGSDTGGRTASLGLARTGSLPARCPVNGVVVVEGQTVELDGVAIEAQANCQIELRDCTITADAVVEAKDANVKVRVVRSTLVGRRTALDMRSSNPRIEIDAESVVKGKTAVAAGVNAKIEVAGKVTGDRVGLALDNNAKVSVREGGTIEGREAIRAGTNLEVRLDGGVVRGARKAISANRMKLIAVGEASLVEGPTAVEARHQATVELREGATVKASRVAIETGHALELVLEGAKIRSEGDGVKAGYSLSLVAIEGSVLEAGEQAIRAAYDVSVELESSRIVAGTTAIEGRRKKKLEVDANSEIVGAQTFRR